MLPLLVVLVNLYGTPQSTHLAPTMEASKPQLGSPCAFAFPLAKHLTCVCLELIFYRLQDLDSIFDGFLVKASTTSS